MIYLSLLASSMKGLFSTSDSIFHSAPSRLEISELCIFGLSCAILRRWPLDQTMNAFMGLLMWSLDDDDDAEMDAMSGAALAKHKSSNSKRNITKSTRLVFQLLLDLAEPSDDLRTTAWAVRFCASKQNQHTTSCQCVKGESGAGAVGNSARNHSPTNLNWRRQVSTFCSNTAATPYRCTIETCVCCGEVRRGAGLCDSATAAPSHVTSFVAIGKQKPLDSSSSSSSSSSWRWASPPFPLIHGRVSTIVPIVEIGRQNLISDVVIILIWQSAMIPKLILNDFFLFTFWIVEQSIHLFIVF